MKTKMIVLAILIGVLGGRAQNLQIPHYTVVPIENYNSYIENHNHIPDGTYFKDVNHVLDDYIGTWTGTYNNMSYEIKLELYTTSFLNIKSDCLIMRCKITDNSGLVIINTLNVSDDNAYEGFGFAGDNNEYYKFVYGNPYDDIANCGDVGLLGAKLTTNNTKMQINISPSEIWLDPDKCPDGYQSPPFPTFKESPLVLTKQ